MKNLQDILNKKGDSEITPENKVILTYDKDSDLNIIIFSFDGISFPICQKLVQEGNNIIVAQVKSKKDLGEDDKEDPEVKRRRLSVYDGLLDKKDANAVLEAMKDIENKDDWIIFFDFNSMGHIAEKVLEMGFTKGLFPTTKDYELEGDRNKAKDIIKKNYPDLTIADVHEFKQISEGIDFLNDTEQLWVLKGNSDGAKTIVPSNDDPELAKQIIIDALEAHKKDYEKDGFILEEKIVGGLELTPQAVFLDGRLIFTDIDIENKNIGAGNLSVQTGAMQTLVIKTQVKDKINDLAFPDWVYKQAKEHVGLFIVDAGIMCKDDKYYFTEFCFQRFGWDSIFAEICMSGNSTKFFKKIFDGVNPLKAEFGVAVRGLNMHKDDKERRVLEGVSITIGDEPDTFVYEMKQEGDKLVSTGGYWDLVVFAGCGEKVNEAVEEAYDAIKDFAFEDLLYRPDSDFMCCDYDSSIACRFEQLNHHLFEAPDLEGDDIIVKRKIDKIKRDYKEKLGTYRKNIEDALNEQEQGKTE